MKKKKALTVHEMGRRGGTARGKNLTPEQLSKIGKKGARTRWAKKPGKKGGKLKWHEATEEFINAVQFTGCVTIFAVHSSENPPTLRTRSKRRNF